MRSADTASCLGRKPSQQGLGDQPIVTLKTPSVTSRVPVAPEPATGSMLNVNVPPARNGVNMVSVTLPLPTDDPACHARAGSPTCNVAFVVVSGPIR